MTTMFTAEMVADHCNETMATAEGWVADGDIILPIAQQDFIQFLKVGGKSLHQLGQTVMLVNINDALSEALNHAVADDNPVSFLSPMGLLQAALMVGMERPNCIVINMTIPNISMDGFIQEIRRYPALAKITIVALATADGFVATVDLSLFAAIYRITTPVVELIANIKELKWMRRDNK